MSRWYAALVFFVTGGLIGSFVAAPWLQGQQTIPLAVPKEMSSYRDVVKRVLPAVVSIEGKAKPAAKETVKRGVELVRKLRESGKVVLTVPSSSGRVVGRKSG